MPRPLSGLVLLALLLAACGETGGSEQPADSAEPIPVRTANVTPSPTPAPSPTPVPTPTPRLGAVAPTSLARVNGVLLGAWVDPDLDPSPRARLAARDALERALDRRLAIDHVYYGWEAAFPLDRERADLDEGRIPLITWARYYSWRILNGSQDELIALRARSLRDLIGPVFLRWAPDPDLAENAVYRGSAEEYVGAYRHIIEIFRREGASNVLFVWSASAGAFPKADVYYPGDGYVDWVAADGLDLEGKTAFHALFTEFHRDWGARGKPLMISEIGTVDGDNGYKARWFSDISQVLHRDLPRVRAVVFWDSVYRPRPGVRSDLRVNSSESAATAFKLLARDDYLSPMPSPATASPPASATPSAAASVSASASASPAAASASPVSSPTAAASSSPTAYPSSGP